MSIHLSWDSVVGLFLQRSFSTAASWFRRCFSAKPVLAGIRNLILRSTKAASETSYASLDNEEWNFNELYLEIAVPAQK